jgi:glycosyltransferase involved in cell wall biosynthesis
MRLAVYTDYTYMQDAEGVTGERAFVRFMVAMAPNVERLTLVGRLRPEPGRSHYPIPDGVDFVGLPFYTSLTRPFAVLASLWRSGQRFWRMLDDADAVWLMGPYIHAVVFALLAAARRKRVFLGVRQDYPVYVRSRHPDKRWVLAAAQVLETTFQTMARRWPVIVVGPDLARNYRRATSVLTLTVSLVSDDDLVDPEVALTRAPREPMRLLSVGRLDREKNPLLLADAIARARELGVDCVLDVVGEGAMADQLAARIAELGIEDAVTLRGYVPIDGGLLELYREADAFLHVSWTEGLPQVLFEAFAAAIPVIATDVGGVKVASDGAALLIGAGDPEAAAQAIRQLHDEPGLRERLVRAGGGRVRAHTMEHEAAQLAAFLQRG